MSKQKGPQFVQYFSPVIDVLRNLGGSGTPGEVTDAVAELLSIPQSQQEETLPSGEPRFKNQVAWARFYLVKADLIDASKRGIWSLTAKGEKTNLSHEKAPSLFKVVHKQFPAKKEIVEPKDNDNIAPEEAQEHIDHRAG